MIKGHNNNNPPKKNQVILSYLNKELAKWL